MRKNIQIDFGDAIKFEKKKVVDENETPEGENHEMKRRVTFVGTPLYVSPEMLKDNLSSIAGDMWALGCIIY